ncbi:MAG: FAD-dependent oxidoreductase [Oscillospiraceae bacterium]|nr:FAD-dependent oxidoreductase [Oscillospiraceae bacterium]
MKDGIKSNSIYSKTVAVILAAVILVSIVGAVLTRSALANTQVVSGPIIDGQEAFHVIVTSGEPEGVAAAVSAARNGMRTLLIESGDALGGLMTLGKLNILDQSFLNRHLLTQGVFQEYYNAVGDAFDIIEAKDWFMAACLAEPNLTVMLNTEIIRPIMQGNTIVGLEIRENGSSSTEVVRSLVVIDATVDADIAAAAGAPYTWGGEDHGQHGLTQGVTLVFAVSDVDWDVVVNRFRFDGSPITGADAKRAWGFADEARNFVSIDGNMRFRGPNFARQNNENVLLNALIIFGVDPLDPESLQDGIDRGLREIPNVIDFMRANFVGFENAQFAEHASRLYVRETRHFVGEYRLTITDLLENRDFWDSIGHGRYPVDLQPSGPDDLGTIVGVPFKYSIPFRTLVPQEIDQLLIVGRSASFDSLPHGSTRVMPIGMVSGQAAGAAAAYSINNDVTFREMTQNPQSIRWLQNQLRRQGALITPFEAPHETVMDHWAYSGMSVLRKLGLAAGGYFNDYGLDNYLTSRWALQNRLNQMMRVINERTEYRGESQIPAWQTYLNTDDITVGVLLRATAEGASLGDKALRQASGVSVGSPVSFTDAYEARDYLVSRGVLNIWNIIYFHDLDETATMGQVMSVLGNLYNILMEVE